VKWRVAYLLSVAMAVEDDSCASLIDAVKFVFEACGVEFYRPPQEHFMSMNDFANHADEIWEELPTRARSEHAPPSSFSLLSLSSCRVVVVSSWYCHRCRRRRRVVVSSSFCRGIVIVVIVVVASSSRRCRVVVVVVVSCRRRRRRRVVVSSSFRRGIVIVVVVSCRVVVVASSLRSVVASSSSASSSRCGVFASLAPLYKTLDILTYLLTYLLPARRYASAVLAAALCPSVCPTQVDVLSRRLGGLSWFLARRLPSTYPTL